MRFLYSFVAAAHRADTEVDAESELAEQFSVWRQRVVTAINAARRRARANAWARLQWVDWTSFRWGHQGKQFQESCHFQAARCFIIVSLLV